MNVTARILGDPPPDLEARRRAAAERKQDPAASVKLSSPRISRGKPVKKG